MVPRVVLWLISGSFENIGLYDRCIVGGDYKSIYSIFGLELPMRDKSFDFKINEYANIIKNILEINIII